MFPITKILYPTDFSEPSRPAFDVACSLARDYGAELLVCHVAAPAVMLAGEGVVLETLAEEVEQVAARLGQVKSDHPQVRLTHVLLRGDPAGEILRLAGDAKPDLIVMGTHGRSGLGRLLMGSVTEAVMRKAPCPVVTVKPPLPSGRGNTTPKRSVTV